MGHFSYTRTGRTTRLVERTMRVLDTVLAKGFNWSGFVWEWRELFTTRTSDGNGIGSFTATYIPHTKWVKVKGMTSTGHVVTAIARFEGCTHEFLDECRNESEPLEVSKLLIKVRTIKGNDFRKTCSFENKGTNFVFE